MVTPIPTVEDYMTANPHSIQCRQSLSAAQRLMQERGVRHLLVWRAAELVGVVTDRDLAAFQGLPDVSCDSIPVEQALTSPPFTVPAQTALNRVAREMVERTCDSAVVLDQGRALGILTSTDALVALADALEGKHTRHARESTLVSPPRAR